MLQPLLSQRESESDRHRTKRANVKAGKLQQKMSALMGRPLGDLELRAIFPSFSAQMPGSAFSGVFPTLACALLHLLTQSRPLQKVIVSVVTFFCILATMASIPVYFTSLRKE